MVTLLYIISLFATCSKAGQWVKGANGQTCDDVCALLSPPASCQADTQSSVTTSFYVKNLFAEAGYECKSFNEDLHRDYAGAPFSTGRSGDDCYFITPGGSKSVCDANANPGHSALCYCDSGIHECHSVCGDGAGCVDTGHHGYACEALYLSPTCGYCECLDNRGCADCSLMPNGDIDCTCDVYGYGLFENVIPVFFSTHRIEIIGALLIINILVMSACIHKRNKYRTRVYKDIHVTESDEEDVFLNK